MLAITTSPPTVPPTAAPIVTPLLWAAAETGFGYADHVLPEYTGIGAAGIVVEGLGMDDASVDVKGLGGASLTST